MSARKLRPDVAKLMPNRMLTRPVDHRGYPVPWFVNQKDADGQWEFRALDPNRYVQAIKQKRCWICGHPLGRYLAFAVGPMGGVNRISAEPPQHTECAMFAVKTCPFMLLPKAKRREANLPEVTRHEAALTRNPGVVLIWTTLSYQVIREPGAFLFRMSAPESLSFWREGRPATRDEILESVKSGAPILREAAQKDGIEAVAACEKMLSDFLTRIDAATAA